MSPSDAILAVLGPIGAFLATLASLFLKRHFKFLDNLEAELKSRGKLDVELATELRLARETREAHDRRLTDLERELSAKIEDQRFQALSDTVREMHTEVIAGGLGAPLGAGVVEEVRSSRRAQSGHDYAPVVPVSGRGGASRPGHRP